MRRTHLSYVRTLRCAGKKTPVKAAHVTCPPLFSRLPSTQPCFPVVTARLLTSAFHPSVSRASPILFLPNSQSAKVAGIVVIVCKGSSSRLPRSRNPFDSCPKCILPPSLKPRGYRCLADREKSTHRASSPDDCLSHQNESENDLFLPSSKGIQSQQMSYLRHHWHLAVEILLLLCNICVLSLVLFRVGDAPLEVRQKECGRLRGQWRRFTISMRRHASCACSHSVRDCERKQKDNSPPFLNLPSPRRKR